MRGETPALREWLLLRIFYQLALPLKKLSVMMAIYSC
jgi:hypothetical protein